MTNDTWPGLEYDGWKDTLATLHLWTQIVGKVRLAASPWINHSWQATLYVTPVGLTTSTIRQGSRAFDMAFDFHRHELVVRTDGGHRRVTALRPMTVAEFHATVVEHLDSLGLDSRFHGAPNELPEPIPFAEDQVHGSYDPAAVTRFSGALNQAARVFTEFRSRFLGKCSPVHFFWGSFDLAVTRFSGRTAPRHPGGIPHLPDWVTREAYSHEVHSCGFWPGSETSPAPAFYAYAYPVPDGLGARPAEPSEAFWSEEMGEYFLPYDAVRTADDPDAALLSFLESTYGHVADLADWDRDALDVPEGFPTREE